MPGLWGLSLAGSTLAFLARPPAWEARAHDVETVSVLPLPAEERTRQLLHTDMVYCTARMIAAIQAVIGQLYMAVVVAVFVGMCAAGRHD